ncbi:hypothetical protein MTR67_043909 [Solanum verrucosum]|uniref:Reverse transcriptase zinc-binding domain-containing protein n=1 Tax=Solanum verrucosum TaxID=315347 RepID=A0AAF0ZVK2_SOLVR|nr:hypothetical protein MTR67_043909 [Solanum verrucosum]
MKRGITLCSRCFLCKETYETVNHMFLHCSYTLKLWRIFLSLKGIFGPCLVKSQRRGGRKHEYMLKTEIDGELSLLLYDGQPGKRGILGVLRA